MPSFGDQILTRFHHNLARDCWVVSHVHVSDTRTSWTQMFPLTLND